jgi:hypothetical protein
MGESWHGVYHDDNDLDDNSGVLSMMVLDVRV